MKKKIEELERAEQKVWESKDRRYGERAGMVRLGQLPKQVTI